MVHRGKRSPEGNAKREKHSFLWKVSYFDDETREIICTRPFDYEITMVREYDRTLFLGRFPFKEVRMPEFTERGEILADTRGQGTFQRR